MASAVEEPTIIEQYSQAFTRLQAGKRELIQWGAEAVKINRFIVDEAENTGQADAEPILQSIDLNKVTFGETESDRLAYCETSLSNLVSLQENLFVLQKTAREKGISGGLLTIIGQAASQSPEDNGASVLRQLTDLVQGDEQSKIPSSKPAVVDTATPVDPTAQDAATAMDDTTLEINAANDIDRRDADRMTGLQVLSRTFIDHWKPLVLDASVCAIAACIAISLVN